MDAETHLETISADAAAIRLGICVGSVHTLIREGVLPATQLMRSAPWRSAEFDVRSAMPSVTAKRKISDLIFVEPRFDAFKAASLNRRGGDQVLAGGTNRCVAHC